MRGFIRDIEAESLSVTDLGRIYADHVDKKALVEEAIGALELLDSDIAWRAVWLLKELARDGMLDEADLVRIAECTGALTHWAARLNLCQLFAATDCPKTARDTLYPYLVDCFGNHRPMIRAWAITVLMEFRNMPEFRKPVAGMLLKARADSAASVRARLRRLGFTEDKSRRTRNARKK